MIGLKGKKAELISLLLRYGCLGLYLMFDCGTCRIISVILNFLLDFPNSPKMLETKYNAPLNVNSGPNAYACLKPHMFEASCILGS